MLFPERGVHASWSFFLLVLLAAVISPVEIVVSDVYKRQARSQKTKREKTNAGAKKRVKGMLFTVKCALQDFTTREEDVYKRQGQGRGSEIFHRVLADGLVGLLADVVFDLAGVLLSGLFVHACLLYTSCRQTGRRSGTHRSRRSWRCRTGYESRES